ncbi:hypothetical protein FC093_22870 [Ilyomonas limi]|uniref:Uncharacterized protein n=1 Tax=Ilyomonas limi TaxID=2575867 RepID=A0A4U3KPT8_9BACT|nr:hypothetical protein [Ilyomonas limi]TKK64275.1 hypothetical protein FC093_22870 [Ilyomonas limi]
MKKTPLLRSIVFVSCFVCSIVLVSCKKEAVSTPEPAVSTASQASATAMRSSEISTAISPFGVLGKYFDRGSRTLYRGKAGVDNAILSLDYFNEKKVVAAFDTKSLTCGYGETNLVNKGWKYLIRYDMKKGEITLAPNDVMAADIQPNSFKTLTATYDAASKTFNFMTRYTDKDGNDNDVFDIMTKE